MKATRIAARMPMKKLFAVALVGTASTTAIALQRSAPSTPTHEPCGGATPVGPSVAIAPELVVVEPVATPEAELVITPLALRTGSPACGNVTFKGNMGPPPCTTAERALKVIMRTAIAGMRTDAM